MLYFAYIVISYTEICMHMVYNVSCMEKCVYIIYVYMYRHRSATELETPVLLALIKDSIMARYTFNICKEVFLKHACQTHATNPLNQLKAL